MAIKGGNWEMSDTEFERQFAEATRRGAMEATNGAYAIAARYDKVRRQIIVELANGMSLLIPAHLIQGLQEATTKELADIEILGAGSGLYWPQLTVDIGVEGLLNGRFGTKSWMAALKARPGAVATNLTVAARKQRLNRLASRNEQKRQRAA